MRIMFLLCLCFIATSAYAEGWVVDKTTGCKSWSYSPESNNLYVNWSGECVGGLMNGQGIIKYYNKTSGSTGGKDELRFTFEGYLKDGMQTGNAISYGAKYKYVGEYKDGRWNGKGTFTTSSGVQYDGEFIGGKRNGKGTMILSNGNKYVGDFKDDYFDGTGIYTEANGDQYIGRFYKGEKHGNGTFTFKNGDSYKGLWENGHRIKIF